MPSGDCYLCKKKDVEGREVVVRKYEDVRYAEKVTSEVTVHMCKDCDPLCRKVDESYKLQWNDKLDTSRFGRGVSFKGRRPAGI